MFDSNLDGRSQACKYKKVWLWIPREIYDKSTIFFIRFFFEKSNRKIYETIFYLNVNLLTETLIRKVKPVATEMNDNENWDISQLKGLSGIFGLSQFCCRDANERLSHSMPQWKCKVYRWDPVDGNRNGRCRETWIRFSKNTLIVSTFGAFGLSFVWCKHKTPWLFERFVFYKKKFPLETLLEEIKLEFSEKNFENRVKSILPRPFELIGLLHKAQDHWCFDGEFLHKYEASDWVLDERPEPWIFEGENFATQTKLNTISAFSRSLNPGIKELPV